MKLDVHDRPEHEHGRRVFLVVEVVDPWGAVWGSAIRGGVQLESFHVARDSEVTDAMCREAVAEASILADVIRWTQMPEQRGPAA